MRLTSAAGAGIFAGLGRRALNTSAPSVDEVLLVLLLLHSLTEAKQAKHCASLPPFMLLKIAVSFVSL